MRGICSGTLMALLLAGNVFAQNASSPSASVQDCKKVSNPTKRLACFDNQQKAKEQSAEDEKIRKAAEDDQKRKADEEQKKKSEFVSAARACLSAIRKLEARVSVGISYRDYYAPLADTKFEVESFVRGPNGAYNQEFTSRVSKALSHYQMAGSIWSLKFSGRRVNDDMAITPEILSLYPSAAAHTRTMSNFQLIEYNKLLSIIWAEAKSESSEAEKALTTSNSNTPKAPTEPKDASN